MHPDQDVHCRCIAVPVPWISKDHREGFIVGLVVGLIIGFAGVIGTIVVLTR